MVYVFGWVGYHSKPGLSGPTVNEANGGQWNINWQAIGYVC